MDKNRVIGFKIKCISNMIRRKLDDRFSAPEFEGLTGAQNAIMGFIMDSAPKREIFQKDIEREFNIRRSSATVMLQGLEQKGFIRRISVEYDARLKKIELTPKAEKMQQKVRHEIDLFHKEIEKDLTDKEREQLIDLLDKIKKNLEEMTEC